MHRFKELNIWNKSMVLSKEVYSYCRMLPREERYGLISKMQRSSVSIPSNIAEGAGIDSKKSFYYFVQIAIASSFELETQFLLSKDIYTEITDEKYNDLYVKLAEVQKMLVSFRKHLSH